MKRTFDRFSSLYDPFMRFFNFYRDDLIIDSLSLDGTEVLIDIGGGTGHLARKLTPLCRKVFVLDESLGMLSKAGEGGPIGRVAGDAIRTPFRDESFDAAILSDVLHHIRESSLLLDEAGRILKRGGRLLIHDFNRENPVAGILMTLETLFISRVYYLKERDLADMLRNKGLREIRTIQKGYYFVALWEKV